MAISTTALAVTSLVIGATSAVASGIAQHQQAKAQDAFNAAQAEQYKKSYEQQSRAAAQEYANQSAAERVSQMQEKEKTAIEVQEAQQEALQKKGTMMASTNAAGGTLDFLLDDYARKEAQAKEKLRTQYEMSAVASDFAVESYRNKAQNRLDSRSDYTYIDSGTNIGNTMLTTALGIGSSAVNSYDMYKRYSK